MSVVKYALLTLVQLEYRLVLMARQGRDEKGVRVVWDLHPRTVEVEAAVCFPLRKKNNYKCTGNVLTSTIKASHRLAIYGVLQ